MIYHTSRVVVFRVCQDLGVSTVYDCNDPDGREAGLAAAASAVRLGGLVVLPTDTVYGVGADAFDPSAVAALLAAKGRGRDMPVPVLVGSWSTVDGLVMSVPRHARALIEAFGLAGSAVLEGRVDDMVEAYHSGSIVALTSISEGFPYTVVEAMASGRTVVCTNVGGVAEAVGDALLVRFADGRVAEADHLMFGTGYKVDVTRYPWMTESVLGGLRRVDGQPLLRRGLESSLPGLHFVGTTAAYSFGPVQRFVSGSWYAARAVSRSLAGRPLLAQRFR